MTTIAWDGVTLASDSRIVKGSRLISDKYQKIYSFPSGYSYHGDELLAIGISGVVADFDKAILMITSKSIGCLEFDNKCEIDAIIIGEKFVYEMEEGQDFLIRHEKSTKLACGSGAVFARTAMHLNKNAKQAVKVAIDLDCGCGGEVQSMRFTGGKL